MKFLIFILFSFITCGYIQNILTNFINDLRFDRFGFIVLKRSFFWCFWYNRIKGAIFQSIFINGIRSNYRIVGNVCNFVIFCSFFFSFEENVSFYFFNTYDSWYIVWKLMSCFINNKCFVNYLCKFVICIPIGSIRITIYVV